jgi:hypothetical protein
MAKPIEARPPQTLPVIVDAKGKWTCPKCGKKHKWDRATLAMISLVGAVFTSCGGCDTPLGVTKQEVIDAWPA